MPDGRLDPSFGHRGEVLAGPHRSSCTTIRPAGSGGVLVAGLRHGITAFTAWGTIDRGFGDGGRAVVSGLIMSLLKLGSKTIAVDGSRFRATALTPHGRLFSGFGESGNLRPGSAVSGAVPSDALVQRGDLILAGNRGRHGEPLESTAEPDSEMVIARYHGF